MIFIRKPQSPPRVLLEKGRVETEKNKALFDQHADDFRSGAKVFLFKKSIFSHKTVKLALLEAQHCKCCFCERRIEIGDVEHYRCKGAVLQKVGEPKLLPGYFWLAYDWENLLFCCEKCNRSFKRIFFPLANPADRAISPHHDLSAEKPLLIHPAVENPEDFIEYVADVPRAKAANERGLATIQITGIDRPFLAEDRFRHYQMAKSIFEAAQLPGLPAAQKLEFERLLQKMVGDDAPFASMVRCAMQASFRF